MSSCSGNSKDVLWCHCRVFLTSGGTCRSHGKYGCGSVSSLKGLCWFRGGFLVETLPSLGPSWCVCWSAGTQSPCLLFLSLCPLPGLFVLSGTLCLGTLSPCSGAREVARGWTGTQSPFSAVCHLFGHSCAEWLSGGALHIHPSLFITGQLCDRPHCPWQFPKRW